MLDNLLLGRTPLTGIQMLPPVGKLLALSSLTSLITLPTSEDPDARRDTSAIIRSRGFIAEEHDVHTKDGYILTIYRIVRPGGEEKGKPVLLMHPLTGESANFIINTPTGFANESTSIVGNNLGFELAKRGYDVWLGNVRGNTNGRRHKSMSVDDSNFWRFSIDEHSAIDLPSMIQYIQKNTHHDKIDYVGHSQGTMIVFALLSRSPEYSESIDRFIALGPVSYLGQVSSPLKYLMDNFAFRTYLNFPGSFLPPNSILLPLARLVCPTRIMGSFCTNFLFIVCGYSKQIDKSRLPVIVAHAPAGTSKQNMLHYLQLVRSKRFTMFDHGSEGNMKRYGKPDPPDYDVSKINHTKISLIWGENDILADPDDIQILKQKLRVKLADDYKIPIKMWNHLDHLWAREAGKYVNEKVIQILARR